MRVYMTTTVPEADAIFRRFQGGDGGYRDLHKFAGYTGVWFADRRLDANDGFDDPLTLCQEVPDDVFARYEWGNWSPGYRAALIPAEVLNRLGAPAVYDHSPQDPRL
jgi:hypothetical protein